MVLRKFFSISRSAVGLKDYQISLINLQEGWPISWYNNDFVIPMK